MASLHLDAEALYADLLGGVRALLQPDTALVGIWSGGAWLAERLQRDLSWPANTASSAARCIATTSGRADWLPAPTTRAAVQRR